MIDQRAMDKATAALAGYMRRNPPLQFHNKHTGKVDAIISDLHARACIEAYEAARPDPNPWRPLSEIDCAKPGRVLVWMPVDDLNDRLFVDRVWPPEGDSRDWQDYAARPENSGAMFRTIEPPTQDADCSAPGPTKNERG